MASRTRVTWDDAAKDEELCAICERVMPFGSKVIVDGGDVIYHAKCWYDANPSEVYRVYGMWSDVYRTTMRRVRKLERDES